MVAAAPLLRPADAGALPGAPPRPLPVGVGPSPRARRAGACTPSRLHPPSGLHGLRCCTPHDVYLPPPRPRCGPVARPHRDGGARRRSAPWPCPAAEEKKQKQKCVGVWGGGGGGGAFEPSQGGGRGPGVSSPYAAGRTTGSGPPAPRPCILKVQHDILTSCSSRILGSLFICH